MENLYNSYRLPSPGPSSGPVVADVPLPPSGYCINRRWVLADVIGEGGYGCVYSAHEIPKNGDQGSQPSDDCTVAVKIEKVPAKRPLLKMETLVLKLLLSQGSRHAVDFLGCGNEGSYSYLAMELVGKNLNQLRRSRAYGRFSLSTAIRLGKQMLGAIQDVHNAGFVHRDIKPGNFAVGLGRRARDLYILDFGLARQFCDQDGNVRPARANAGFRGTMRYSSVSSMQRHEQDRRDDLMSFLYVLCEFFRGPLPWRRAPTKELVLQMKQQYNRDRLLEGLPEQMYYIYDHVAGLQYGDVPDYERMLRWLDEIAVSFKVKDEQPFDWEDSSIFGVPSNPSIPVQAFESSLVKRWSPLPLPKKAVQPKAPQKRSAPKPKKRNGQKKRASQTPAGAAYHDHTYEKRLGKDSD